MICLEPTSDGNVLVWDHLARAPLSLGLRETLLVMFKKCSLSRAVCLFSEGFLETESSQGRIQVVSVDCRAKSLNVPPKWAWPRGAWLRSSMVGSVYVSVQIITWVLIYHQESDCELKALSGGIGIRRDSTVLKNDDCCCCWSVFVGPERDRCFAFRRLIIESFVSCSFRQKIHWKLALPFTKRESHFVLIVSLLVIAIWHCFI